MSNIPGWTQFFMDSQGMSTNDLTGRQREDLISNTMEVHGMSREEAISYLGDLGLDGRPVSAGIVSQIAAEDKKKKKKKKRKSSYS